MTEQPTDLRQFITFAEAAKLLPARRAGKATHKSSLYRWSTRGIRGERLATWLIGGVRCTTRSALQEFLIATNAGGLRPKAAMLRTLPAQGPRRLNKAAARLKQEFGI